MKSIPTLTMNPAIDLSASVENVIPEHKLRCISERHDPGGGGINVSRAIKRLGVSPSHITLVAGQAALS